MLFECTGQIEGGPESLEDFGGLGKVLLPFGVSKRQVSCDLVVGERFFVGHGELLGAFQAFLPCLVCFCSFACQPIVPSLAAERQRLPDEEDALVAVQVLAGLPSREANLFFCDALFPECEVDLSSLTICAIV